MGRDKRRREEKLAKREEDEERRENEKSPISRTIKGLINVPVKGRQSNICERSEDAADFRWI